MKVLHAIAGLSPNAGGPSRSVPGLCRALSDAGVETWLLSFSPSDELTDPRGVHFIKGLGLRYADALQTAQVAIDSASPDLVHVHGLWTPANHALITRARKRGIPLVISVRGMLDPWALAQKRWKKRLAMLLYQRRDLHAAALLHATAQQECANIRKQRFRQPVAVIPNGVDVPDGLPLARHGVGEPADRLRTALFVARLHPGKGLLDLADAWARARPQGWRMRVVGPDTHGHQAEVATRLQALGIEQEWIFEGAADDTGKWRYYQEADLFILPSHSENFGISIAEALYAGLPVITTKGTPWQELLGNLESSKVPKCGSAEVVGTASPLLAVGTRRPDMQETENLGTSELSNFRTSSGRCGWWVDLGAAPLAEALRQATGLTNAERQQMGLNGRNLIEAKYRWAEFAEQMKSTYSWLLSSKGAAPACLFSKV